MKVAGQQGCAWIWHVELQLLFLSLLLVTSIAASITVSSTIILTIIIRTSTYYYYYHWYYDVFFSSDLIAASAMLSEPRRASWCWRGLHKDVHLRYAAQGRDWSPPTRKARGAFLLPGNPFHRAAGLAQGTFTSLRNARELNVHRRSMQLALDSGRRALQYTRHPMCSDVLLML